MWSYSKAQLCGLYPCFAHIAGTKAHNKDVIAQNKAHVLVWHSCKEQDILLFGTTVGGSVRLSYVIPAFDKRSKRQTNKHRSAPGIKKHTGKSFFCHFWKIYTIESFLMKKFKKSDDSKFHLCFCIWWLPTTAKKIQQTTPKSWIC